MALKDWEKIKEQRKYPNAIHWENKKAKGYVLYSHPFKTSHEVEIFEDINDIHNTPKRQKSFKSKSQAISYAKQYMRNH